MRAMIFVVAIVGACSESGASMNDYSLYKCKAEVADGIPNGNHNPGMDCQGSCHDHGYTISGTVFVDATTMAPAVGATVNVRDANLKMITMVTASNGNFYTMEPFAYPFRTWVSECPSVELMPDFVDSNTNLGASCNQSICHNNGAGTGVITLNQ